MNIGTIYPKRIILNNHGRYGWMPVKFHNQCDAKTAEAKINHLLKPFGYKLGTADDEGEWSTDFRDFEIVNEVITALRAQPQSIKTASIDKEYWILVVNLNYGN
jgi:hypothetical protein